MRDIKLLFQAGESNLSRALAVIENAWEAFWPTGDNGGRQDKPNSSSENPPMCWPPCSL